MVVTYTSTYVCKMRVLHFSQLLNVCEVLGNTHKKFVFVVYGFELRGTLSGVVTTGCEGLTS